MPTLEKVRQNRICVSLWACAYEFFDHSFVSDAKFDETCKEVYDTLDVATNRPDLDFWFKREFAPDTGSWIHQHPDLDYFKRKAHYFINDKYGKMK